MKLTFLFVIYYSTGASTFVVALHASFYNIDAVVTEEFEAFLTETETVWILNNEETPFIEQNHW